MPETHDLGPLYVSHMRYLHKKAAPVLAERGTTHEIEHPWRRGRALVFRVPFTLLGLVVGLWGRPGHEAATMNAIGCRELGPLDLAKDDEEEAL